MSIKIRINKIKNTCVIFDSVLYSPIKENCCFDFYEIPCEIGKKYKIEIVHYSGNKITGIESVINNINDNKCKSVFFEMKSLDINLYYCKISAQITINKENQFIEIDSEQIKHKDIIGESSFCKLRIVQIKNVILDEMKIDYYSSKKTKTAVYFLEIFLPMLSFIVLCSVSPLAINYYIEQEMNPYLSVGSFYIILIVLMILELIRVAKHTLKIGLETK